MRVNLYKNYFLSFYYFLKSNKKVFHPSTFLPLSNTHVRKLKYFLLLILFSFPNQIKLRVFWLRWFCRGWKKKCEKMVERSICLGREGGEKTIGARPTRVFSLRTHQNSISSNWEENRGKVIVAYLQSNKWNILSFYVLDLVLTIIFSWAYDLLENCFWTLIFLVTFFF